jgi:hypothetical protein
MFLVIFLDANRYQLLTSLHSSLAAAEATYEGLLRRFVIAPGETLPPKASWGSLCDFNGEGVHIFQVELDGGPAKEIFLGSEALATA